MSRDAPWTLEEIRRPACDSDVAGLAALLMDAVRGGASVSFLASLTPAQAERWWRETIEAADPRGALLVARDATGVVGSVLLHPAWAPNQPHRAEIAKLLVHRRARRRGMARALMQAIENRARTSGFTLLTLDTKREDLAEQLYRSSGWNVGGTIPGYALDPDGRACDTVIFYKQL